jgi:hypothetical protein
MTYDRSELQGKLDDIDVRINDIRHQLELRGNFDSGHEVTRVELHERQKLLTQQLREELTDLEAHGHHVSGLEKLVMDWGNRLNF